MMRNGAPSSAMALLLNITLLCTLLMPTLSTTRTALTLSAQAVQWMVTTAEQIGDFDVEGSKGHGAAESPDIIPFQTWDVWLTEPIVQLCNRERDKDKDTICCAIQWTWMPSKAPRQRLWNR